MMECMREIEWVQSCARGENVANANNFKCTVIFILTHSYPAQSHNTYPARGPHALGMHFPCTKVLFHYECQ